MRFHDLCFLQLCGYYFFLLDFIGSRKHFQLPATVIETIYQPRVARVSWADRELAVRPTIGSPKLRLMSARTSGSLKKVVALTIARARLPGSPDLKMPEP